MPPVISTIVMLRLFARLAGLILKRASTSRSPGEWSDDDYDVLADGIVVGRIMKAAASPLGGPWLWTLAYGHHEDRTPIYGYEPAPGCDGGVRQELAAAIGPPAIGEAAGAVEPLCRAIECQRATGAQLIAGDSDCQHENNSASNGNCVNANKHSLRSGRADQGADDSQYEECPTRGLDRG
jgi:hypothetical protein